MAVGHFASPFALEGKTHADNGASSKHALRRASSDALLCRRLFHRRPGPILLPAIRVLSLFNPTMTSIGSAGSCRTSAPDVEHNRDFRRRYFEVSGGAVPRDG